MPLHQTDLDQRVHRNQPTHALAEMSFNILHTLSIAAQSSHRVTRICLGISRTLPGFSVRDDVHERVDHNITYEERPPMIAIPAYRKNIIWISSIMIKQAEIFVAER